MRNILLIIFILTLIHPADVFSQKAKTQKPAKKTTVQKKPAQTTAQQKTKAKEETKKTEPVKPLPEIGNGSDEQKVEDIVAFFQFMLNTLGNTNTSSRDKDVLITESYSKIFRDGKVQVEDDLDEAREVITNKDVVAYLKDVDFFFQEAKFEFVVEEVKKSTLPNGQLFYRVSTRRNLTGTTSDGKAVNNTIPRFVEINYNPDDQDLKIVSIYTNEFDEKEALTNWWEELSYEWKSLFRHMLALPDSVTLQDIKKVTSVQEIDVSGNQYVQNIEPLAQLVDLKRLNLSNTKIKDLTAIRNLTELTDLNLSGAEITDLTPLKYSTKLLRLDISNTRVKEIAVLDKMKNLQVVSFEATPIEDFSVLNYLPAIHDLNVAGTTITHLFSMDSLFNLQKMNLAKTKIIDLTPIKSLTKLEEINFDSTRITDLGPLANLTNIKVIHANFTGITDLKPLEKLEKLDRVYCDQTQINREKAEAFTKANPGALIVFDSKDLNQWWNGLTPDWKTVLSKTAKITDNPTKEDLAKITHINSLKLSGAAIADLSPLAKLLQLEVLVADRTSIADLNALNDHRNIWFLDISETNVVDIGVVNLFAKLKEFRADKTKIQNIEPLWGLKDLSKVYVDQSNVHDLIAREFLEKNPKTLIVYKTNHLNRWWGNLSQSWKDVFRSQMGNDSVATRENLHRLVEMETFRFQDAPVTYLAELGEFVRLKDLHFSGTGISSIPPLESILGLKSLHATNSPVQKIESLSKFKQLEDLDLSNTPVDDIEPLRGLKNLRKLNCAGTQIKKLDDLEGLSNLESLDCSNTRVSNLEAISHLPLKTLKCYNTKVSSKDIEKFKKANPECNVIFYR
jgi:Leucine-rich repeat (LRR) protein